MWSAAIVLTLIGLFLLWIMAAFNRLIGLRNHTTTAWKQLDVELKRRHDLIPNLVLAVKSAVNPEPEPLIRVIEARNRTMSVGGVAQKAAQEGQLSQAMQAFFAAAETHPAMQSDVRIRQLLDDLRAVEYRLVTVAQAYNVHAAALNDAQETCPTDVLAGTFHFSPAILFDVSGEAPQG